MTKNVTVLDESGKKIGVTYPKRARGLVKNGRARFIDETTICLACPTDMNISEGIMIINKTNGAETETVPATQFEEALQKARESSLRANDVERKLYAVEERANKERKEYEAHLNEMQRQIAALSERSFDYDAMQKRLAELEDQLQMANARAEEARIRAREAEMRCDKQRADSQHRIAEAEAFASRRKDGESSRPAEPGDRFSELLALMKEEKERFSRMLETVIPAPPSDGLDVESANDAYELYTGAVESVTRTLTEEHTKTMDLYRALIDRTFQKLPETTASEKDGEKK